MWVVGTGSVVGVEVEDVEDFRIGVGVGPLAARVVGACASSTSVGATVVVAAGSSTAAGGVDVATLA